jgi:hypothetical protein
LLRAYPGIPFELVKSGLGASYVRFRSHAAQEEALAVPTIMHEDVQITLEHEELAQCVPVRDKVYALLWGSPLAAEHFTPAEIASLFSGFRDLLEIDPTCFLGSDMSSVKVVVLCERARLVPCDVLPEKGPWGSRVVQIEVIKLWPKERSFVNGEYQRFFEPPLPPFRHNQPTIQGWPAWVPGHAGLNSSAAGAHPMFGRGFGAQLLLAAASAPGNEAPPPSPVSSSIGSANSSERSALWSSSTSPTVTSATPSPQVARSSVVLTELEAASLESATMADTAVPAPVATRDGQLAEAEEEAWTTVIGSAHNRRKTRGKAKVRGNAVRKSSRLAATESAMHLDMTKKAVNLRALKNSLKNCSIKLQAHVGKSKLLQKMTSPLGVKSMSELRAAALGRDKTVPSGADD